MAKGPAQRPAHSLKCARLPRLLVQDDLDAAVTLLADLRTRRDGRLGEATSGDRDARSRHAMFDQPVTHGLRAAQRETHVVLGGTHGVGVTGQSEARIFSLS